MAEASRGNGGDDRTVVFDYIKSPSFRVIRADGVIGAPTPQGLIHFAFYSERPAIPRQTAHELNADGTLGAESFDRRVSRPGVVREMDVDVFVSVDVAEQLANWLRDQVEVIRSHTGSARKPGGDH